MLKRSLDATGDQAAGPPAKEPRISHGSQGGVKHRRAVPPGYLHDLFHTRHLMKSVGLRGPASKPAPGSSNNMSLPVAVTGARLIPAPRPRDKQAFLPAHDKLPSLLEQRKRFLQKKRRAAREATPYCNNPEQPTGLLSLPEDVLLRVVCKLRHDDIKPLFFVCKQLTSTLREAIRFHFNFATPSRDNPQEDSPTAQQARRPERRRQVTALADVMAHLRRGPRATAVVAPGSANRPAGSTGPRVLSFTPAATPLAHQPTPKSRLATPGGGDGAGAATRFGTPAPPPPLFRMTPAPSQLSGAH